LLECFSILFDFIVLYLCFNSKLVIIFASLLTPVFGLQAKKWQKMAKNGKKTAKTQGVKNQQLNLDQASFWTITHSLLLMR